MHRIPIRIVFQGEWPEDRADFLTALVDEAVVRQENGRTVTDLLLLAPVEEIWAEYSITTQIQHYEAHGAKFRHPLQELDSVHQCAYQNYEIVNADAVCWKLWELRNA